MHELSVTQALLDLALEHAKKAKAARVDGIYVEVGRLSSYVDDSIQFYWDILSQGTMAEGAQLHFKRIPFEMQCNECDVTFYPDPDTFDCPHCGSREVHVAAGEELRMTAIDIEREGETEVIK